MGGVIIATVLQQIVAAFLDALRIRFRWATVGNIHHAVSATIGLGLAVAQYLALPGNRIAFPAYCLLVLGARLLLYDPLLNLARRERLTYVSIHTSALTGAWWRRWQVGFWGVREIGAAFIVISFIYILCF